MSTVLAVETAAIVVEIRWLLTGLADFALGAEVFEF